MHLKVLISIEGELGCIRIRLKIYRLFLGNSHSIVPMISLCNSLSSIILFESCYVVIIFMVAVCCRVICYMG